MSKTFMRGLRLLEAIDVHGPLSVTELARLTGIDKSIVSRMLKACEPDGWVVRDRGRLVLGPRAAVLARSSSASELVIEAEPLVEAISGVTGLLAQMYALVGKRAVVVASAGGGSQRLPTGMGTSTPLYATAAGTAVACQLAIDQLFRLLPPDPLPDPVTDMLAYPGYAAFTANHFAGANAPLESAHFPRTRGELSARLEQIRAEGFSVDRGDLHADIGCVAIPWPRGAFPAALVCMGTRAELGASEPLVRRVLVAAAVPGAGREDVVRAAALVPDRSPIADAKAAAGS